MLFFLLMGMYVLVLRSVSSFSSRLNFLNNFLRFDWWILRNFEFIIFIDDSLRIFRRLNSLNINFPYAFCFLLRLNFQTCLLHPCVLVLLLLWGFPQLGYFALPYCLFWSPMLLLFNKLFLIILFYLVNDRLKIVLNFEFFIASFSRGFSLSIFLKKKWRLCWGNLINITLNFSF